MSILEFTAENPWQAFFIGPFLLVLVNIFASFVFRVVNRTLRAVNVAIRGWPPEHLDADGDSVEVFTERARRGDSD